MRWLAGVACLLSLAAAAPGGPGAVRAFARAGKVCWAVGDGGLALRSEDAGETWRKVACGSPADFTAVGFSDERTGYILGGRVVAGHPGGAGVGAVLRTADGGKTWTAVPAGPLGHLHGGWMRGSRGVVFGRPTPRHPSGVWLTVTGGRMWAPVKTSSGGAILAGDPLDASNACLVGPGHRIVFLHRLKQLPIRQPPISASVALTAVRYLAHDACWAAGENGSVLLYAGPGKGWRPLSLSLPRGAPRLADLEAIAVGDRGEVYLAGGLVGVIFRTADRGKKFEALPAPGPGPVHALMHAGGGALLAGGDGRRIWRSRDRGRTWKLVHGGDSVDVLFVAGPGDVSILPALVAHAAAGAEAAVLYAAMPQVRREAQSPISLRGDVPLRSAAAAAGAGGAFVLTDFMSVAGDPAASALEEQQVLKRWSVPLDVPARAEMLRQLVAAVRLYRPKVVALGPDGYEAVGAAAENRLVSRLAAEAVKMAAEESAFPELLKLGLRPWRVERVFTGFEANARFAPPWRKRSLPPRQNLAAEFVGWRYPKAAATSLSMLAMHAAWRMPWVGPMDRPGVITAFRCSEIVPKRPLFTSGLSPAQLRLEPKAPVGDPIATGAVLRAPALLGRNAAAAAGRLLQAAKARGDDPLPADMLYLLYGRLLAEGKLTAAAGVNRSLLAHGRAHPLFGRINVSSVAMAASGEWRTAIVRVRPSAGGPPAKPLDYKAVLRRLLTARWRAWVDDEPGTVLLAKGHALVEDFEAARSAYERLMAFTPDRQWRKFAKTELAAMKQPALAVATGDGRVVRTAAGAVTIDGKLDEKFWKRALAVPLSPVPGGPPAPVRASVRFAAAPAGLVAAVRIRLKARPVRGGKDESDSEPKGSPGWELVVAVDADRDTWTQLVLRCSSKGKRSLKLLTRLAPEAKRKASLLPVQARRDGAGWSVELAAGHGLMGISPSKVVLLRLQVVLTVTDEDGEPVRLYLAAQGDDRLLPHRYALLALPSATPRPRKDTETGTSGRSGW